jgi:hypothetical protein
MLGVTVTGVVIMFCPCLIGALFFLPSTFNCQYKLPSMKFKVKLSMPGVTTYYKQVVYFLAKSQNFLLNVEGELFGRGCKRALEDFVLLEDC